MMCIESTTRSDKTRAGRFVLAFALLGGLVLASCAEESLARSDALTELQRLAFVPAGVSELSGVESPRLDRPLLVDRFEVTRDQWRMWLAAEPAEARSYPREWAEEREKGDGVWPSRFMTFFEAQAFAEDRGMRLATASEWFYVAMGSRAQDWPWDQYAAQAVSNTQEVGLARSSPVGVFEQGKTSHGVYDLIGNVREWVDGSLERRDSRELGGRRDSTLDEFTWAVGGSFSSERRELYLVAAGFNAQSFHRAHRSSEVGMRCVVDAEEYLVRIASDVPAGSESRKRLREVGTAWGRSAVPLLSRLARSAPGESGIAQLLLGASK